MYIVFIVILIILIISFVTFRITCGRTYKTLPFPENECYTKYKKDLNDAINNLKSLEFEEVFIKSFDGTKLYGRLYLNNDSNKIDLCFHGYKGEAIRDFCGGAETIKRTNHNMLLIDERAHGKSDGKTITFGIKERRDGLCWIDYLINRFGKNTKIYLYGISMGAATILMMNDFNLPDNVQLMIADSPFSSPKEIIKKTIKEMKLPPNIIYPFIYLGARIFGNVNLNESSAVEAVKNSKVRILLIHGKSDNFVPFEMSEEIFKNIKSYKEILLTPEADHGMSYMVNKEKYYDTVLKFLNKKNI